MWCAGLTTPIKYNNAFFVSTFRERLENRFFVSVIESITFFLLKKKQYYKIQSHKSIIVVLVLVHTHTRLNNIRLQLWGTPGAAVDSVCKTTPPAHTGKRISEHSVFYLKINPRELSISVTQIVWYIFQMIYTCVRTSTCTLRTQCTEFRIIRYLLYYCIYRCWYYTHDTNVWKDVFCDLRTTTTLIYLNRNHI